MTEHDKVALLNMINKASEALQHVMAAELISKKKLNSYIIAVNDKTDEDMEDANKWIHILNQEWSKDR